MDNKCTLHQIDSSCFEYMCCACQDEARALRAKLEKARPLLEMLDLVCRKFTLTEPYETSQKIKQLLEEE